ncbi:hypothetical protein AGABI1DRAFT_123180 [Agaricus bisporus var. burnettii JB137-S8]|uniref:Nephrocystin 3-like N-terminal domain-containing protein n=1 Tax=Agaricus bisporus var. burnettii (strain JB137-S8 / ATCC MYA-4627 / FGSC 10392) TaxID=597362 RepID=K5WY43_AGABU|nr:uncharacterized protein AGABI1DRAFT_123180 [Agaricus bisporus var. burnettii JB137-S8]EKM75522.1 hypothetical protein AGABI1DRAFT_123180 [Agaricus bisporus var. burnettii JB137-S8]
MSLPVPSIADRTKNWLRLLKRRPRPSSIRPVEGTEPYTCLDATKDSSARHPPPRCHPETRLKVRERLAKWLSNDEWKMLWVRGSAGTGKSAVAQSFGDSCGDEKRHGASYFFSRTAGRKRLETVIPTIVYQLAIAIPEYRYLVEHQLANNPLLLRNSPPVQFRELIIEPFATLQRQNPRESIAIILYGLDECEGEDDQLEILDMITNALRTNPDLPLRWLILSRPEAHLKYAFSKFTDCGREELIIDAACRDDVEKYTRERITQIKDKFRKFTPTDWPPTNQLKELLDTVSGLFIFASTCLNYIGDPKETNPQSQLNSLLAFLRRSPGVMSRNPLAALDLLYSRILANIPFTVFKETRQVLAYMSYRRYVSKRHIFNSTQALCNFLRLKRSDFYKAVDGLHPVMSIAEPEDAAQSPLQFYHASFQDFLLDTNRSGKFAIDEKEAIVYMTQLCIYCLPDNKLPLSRSMTCFLEHPLSQDIVDMQWDGVVEDLLSQLSNVDFRCWMAAYVLGITLLCRPDNSTSVIRTEPSSPTDYQLLEYFNLVIGNGIAQPALFPLKYRLPDGQWNREYFFIGHGAKSVIVWRTKSATSYLDQAFTLRCDVEPSQVQIRKYQEYLLRIKWDEGRAKLEMV